MGNELLSILMPCVPERWEGKVKNYPNWSIKIYPCLTPTNQNGGPTIGEKRDWLVQMAKGEYLTFWDDDDRRDILNGEPNSLNFIFQAIRDRPDVIVGLAKFRDSIIDFDLQYKENQQYIPGRPMITRPPWHVCIYRSEIAKRHHFPFKNYGEDWLWCEKVNADCKTQIRLDKVIYEYQWDEKKTLASLK